ncbi:MAG: Holliday junction branch migration protein RuvA [Clostridia bacterium]|nr:Holliday junction branch migration protein RuvA [Clostridia bacterium]
MIYSLRGVLIESDATSLVVECGGVGYRCTASLNTLSDLPKMNSEVFVYTYMAVREDAVDLFGFRDKAELEMFRLLISVNGVGPKAAISMLSQFKPSDISLCIASGDSKSLTRAAGIGGKTAQRIVLELKDKIVSGATVGSDTASAATAADSSGASEAVSALVALGYSLSEASAAVGKLDKSAPTQQLIKDALKQLARRV